MRARGWVAEVAFAAVLAASLAAPALTTAGRHLASGSGSSGSSSSGSSNGSSGSSNGSSGSSNGSSSSGSGSHASGNGRSGGSGGSDTHSTSPELSSYQAIPRTGTVLYATLRNLPPFLLLSCILGALGVQVDEPLGPDPFSAVNRACSHITVHRLPDRSGPFSDPPTRVRVDEVHLRITVDRTNHVVVDPSVPGQDDNRLLLTLLAAALIVIAALALALARRKGRP